MPPELIYNISRYGYFAVFLLIFLQETGVPNPIPNELVLLVCGYLTFTGVLYLPWVIVTAALADFTGTNILYVVFYSSGNYILKHKPRWIPVSQSTIEGLTRRISGKRGKRMIYIGRLTPFIRGYTSVACGLIKLRPRIFLPIAILSAVTWSGAYVIAGRLLSPYWNHIAGYLGHFSMILLVIMICIILMIAIKYVIRKMLQKRSSSYTNPINKSLVQNEAE